MGTMVFDVDGTLSFDGRTIAGDIVRALECADERHTIVFASARPLRDLAPFVPTTLSHAPLVGANGALTRDQGGVTSHAFDAATRARFDTIVAAHSLTHLIDGEWDFSYTGDGTDSVISKVNRAGANNLPAAELEVYVKALVFAPAAEAERELRQLDLVVTEHSAERVLDLAPRGVDKATGVAALGLSAGEYVAFGNDANDRSLFANAARSYCVGDHPAGSLATARVDPTQVATAITDAAAWLSARD